MNKKILVVEDELPLAKALQLKLTKAGFDAEIAGNGDEALELIKKDKYDMMLLDILMPGTDGFGVLNYYKDNNIKTPPVIVTSNLSQQEDINRAKKLGAVDFMVKSDSSLNDIIERVKQLLT